MRIGIVLKLFMLTTLLCMLILATIFIGQTIFFKQYYANQKINDINAGIETFVNNYLKTEGNGPDIKKLEKEFYDEYTTWITILDSIGNIKYANDFSVEIQLERSRDEDFSNRVIHLPLYSLIELEDIERAKFYFDQRNRIFIDGVKRGKKIIPAILTVERNFTLENIQLSEKLFGRRAEVAPYYELSEKSFDGKVEQDPSPQSKSTIYLTGDIKELHLPDGTLGLNIYSNRLFIERIMQFQVNSLLNKNINIQAETVDYEENDIEHKILIRPVKDANGETSYIFAMTSLQPVDEAVQMLEDYYVYLILFVLLLSLLASFYYSRKIAKPLLEINKTTNKIANLDFSETIQITSKDELGELSQNINTLSTTLHSHIQKLQRDIEKEKQLENTRKEFISGVSHELKTPLSIMKSCISILEDGVAHDKKDYYFQAMSKEVDKMDMLIVDMLDLAKFESGTYKLDMESFYIDEVIEYICEQLASEVASKQLHLDKQLSQSKVLANQLRIEQVITNFITNAIRYTPENQRIFISTHEEQERIKVCVENKGVHIPPDQLEKIWERFYRGDSSRKRSKGGTGLGLAISKKILDLHGVPYGVTNTTDGVLFYFYLELGRRDRFLYPD